MSIIERRSEKTRDYRAYQARMNALRVQAAMEESQRNREALVARALARILRGRCPHRSHAASSPRRPPPGGRAPPTRP